MDSDYNKLIEITGLKGAPLTPIGQAELRKKITELEKRLLQETQAEIPPVHYFSRDVYAREITMKKGTLVVGAIHKHKNLNIISKGKVSFFSIDGAYTVEAPHTFVASPGVKRVIFAHTDTVWTTIHGTPETDLKKIEEEFIASDYEEAYLATDRTLDDVLATVGISADDLWTISDNPDNLMDFDSKYPVEVKPSEIHGLGLFAKRDFVPGEFICPARIGENRTPAGRYCNHSGAPNAKMIRGDNGIALVSFSAIKCGEEVLTDYFFNYKLAKEY